MPAMDQGQNSIPTGVLRGFHGTALVSMEHLSPAPADAQPLRYWFAGFRLEADGTLLRGDTALSLSTEEAAALRFLLNGAGEIVRPLELKRAVWGEEHASNENVAECIASLRERLQPSDCIESLYRRGYRISVAIKTKDAQPAGALPRLAILPFAIGYGVPEFLGSAIAEATAAQLGGGEFAVATIVARESVFTLARLGMTPHEIGKALEADLVLAGELHATPERLKLRVEMIRVADGAQLWIEYLMVERGQMVELERKLVSRVTSRIGSDGLTVASGGSGRSLARGLAAERRAAWGVELGPMLRI